MRWLERLAVGVCVAGVLGGIWAARPDPAGAERQYRIARRLAAQGAPDAVDAFDQALELDPEGALADDILVERAMLEELARWPCDLGRLNDASGALALGLLSRVVDHFPEADRRAEALYLRALLWLEPLPLHDPSDARLDLLAAAQEPAPSEWAEAARYVLAWLAEQQGKTDRARDAYQRLVVDRPSSAAASRARVGLARIGLHRGEFGFAAGQLQNALGHDMPGEVQAAPLRELAVRLLRRDLGGSAFATAGLDTRPTGVRGLTGFSAAPAGGLLVADRRDEAAILVDESGRAVRRWALHGIQQVTVSPIGRFYAADANYIYRLDETQRARPVGSLESLSSPSDLAADALGGIWILDRKGTRLGRLAPGAGSPAVLWESAGSRLSRIAWDGQRIVGLDGKGRRLVALGLDGSERPLGQANFERPVALAADLAGNVAIVDVKQRAVILVDPTGDPVGRFDYQAHGIERPTAIDFGLDGTLHLFDDATGNWVDL